MGIATESTGTLVQIPLQHMKQSFPGMMSPSSVAVQCQKGNIKEVFLDLSSLG